VILLVIKEQRLSKILFMDLIQLNQQLVKSEFGLLQM